MGILFKFFISILFYNKQVYFVTGARRSGNHAFINWLLNAIKKEKIKFELLEHGVSSTKDKDILFFNDMERRGKAQFILYLFRYFPVVMNSKHIIISTEDHKPLWFDAYIPFKAKKIYVHRSILNVIASRLAKSKERAKEGLERGDMMLDYPFFDTLLFMKKKVDKSSWFPWYFDDWSESEVYRHDFLSSLGLIVDIKPDISHEGGGSSFTGMERLPSSEELKERFKLVEIPNHVIKNLKKEHISQLMTEKEQTFIKKLNSDI